MSGGDLAGAELAMGAAPIAQSCGSERRPRIGRRRAIRYRTPLLAAYLDSLGNTRIRMQGKLGGYVMAGMPGYEILPILQLVGGSHEMQDGKVPAAEPALPLAG